MNLIDSTYHYMYTIDLFNLISLIVPIIIYYNNTLKNYNFLCVEFQRSVVHRRNSIRATFRRKSVLLTDNPNDYLQLFCRSDNSDLKSSIMTEEQEQEEEEHWVTVIGYVIRRYVYISILIEIVITVGCKWYYCLLMMVNCLIVVYICIPI